MCDDGFDTWKNVNVNQYTQWSALGLQARHDRNSVAIHFAFSFKTVQGKQSLCFAILNVICEMILQWSVFYYYCNYLCVTSFKVTLFFGQFLKEAAS